MLIRLANDDLVEYPDEVGALALADPSHGDVEDMPIGELNLFINALLGMLFKEKLTLEQNIERAKDHYTKWGTPTESNMAKALAQIKFYNENIAPAEVGYGPLELVKELYGIQPSKPKVQVYIIDNVLIPPKKLLESNENSAETKQQAADDEMA